MPARRIRKRYDRAKRVVFPPVLDSVKSKSYPHHRELVQDAKYMPQDIVWGSREHLLILFFLNIYMKGGINSESAIAAISRFYNDYPEIFLPENLLGLESYELEWVMDWLGWILPQYGLGVNINEAKRHWVWNSLKLARFWQSDPLNLFTEVQKNADATWLSYRVAKRNYSQLCHRIIRRKNISHEELMETPNGFYGFQHKMVSMLAYFYIHAGVVKHFAYPVPVDFHILRVLFVTGILYMKRERGRAWQYRERAVPLAREVTLRFVLETGEDPQLLADGLWLLSRTLCRWYPGNKCSAKWKTPKGEKSEGRHRHVTEIPIGAWTPDKVRLYEKSCGICPIEQHCKHTFPSAFYYVKGICMITGPRQKPVPIQMRLIDVPLSPPSTNGNGHKSRPLPVLPDPDQLIVFA